MQYGVNSFVASSTNRQSSSTLSHETQVNLVFRMIFVFPDVGGTLRFPFIAHKTKVLCFRRVFREEHPANLSHETAVNSCHVFSVLFLSQSCIEFDIQFKNTK